MAKNRSQVKKSDTWDLSKLYKNTKAWEEDFAAVKKLLPKINAFKGKLSSVPVVLDCFKLYDKLGRLFEKVSAYAEHKADEDMGNSENGKRKNRVKELAAFLNESTAFINPELLAQPDNFLPALLKLRKFADWSQEIKELIRERPHTLPREQEELLAKFSETFGAPHDIAEALRDNDMIFPPVMVVGKKTEITNTTTTLLRRHPNRKVREASTKKFFGTYRKFRTVLCSALYAHIKQNVIEARARNYPSVMDYLVAEDNLPLSVHQTLFQVVNDHLPLMHRYCEIRRQKLGVRKLHWHDLYVSLVPNIKDKFSYERAVELILASVAPLGTEYVSALKAGLTTARWG